MKSSGVAARTPREQQLLLLVEVTRGNRRGKYRRGEEKCVRAFREILELHGPQAMYTRPSKRLGRSLATYSGCVNSTAGWLVVE